MLFDQYVFPVVTLSADTEPAALCTIFETLNRTGVKLSVFELLTARFWSQDLKLRELWEQARSDHPLIAHFDVDPYYVLMAIALYIAFALLVNPAAGRAVFPVAGPMFRPSPPPAA
jgi:hypothetical protein